jgi:A/G-specific adenine glycosylase
MVRKRTRKRVTTPKTVAKKLLTWADQHSRRLPWRDSADSFSLAVAEILLQKTKGEDVVPVWAEVLASYPDAAALAGAGDADLRAIIERLGLRNQRVQRLKFMARALAEGRTAKIPGLGSYATAILTLAQGNEPGSLPVDGNISRVICRFYGLAFERGEPRKKPAVKQAVAALLATQANPAMKLRLIYALVDFGAIVCTAPSPHSDVCLLSRWCVFTSQRASARL